MATEQQPMPSGGGGSGLLGGLVCRMFGHAVEPAIDGEGLVYVRCRTCRKDLTIEGP